MTEIVCLTCSPSSRFGSCLIRVNGGDALRTRLLSTSQRKRRPVSPCGPRGTCILATQEQRVGCRSLFAQKQRRHGVCWVRIVSEWSNTAGGRRLSSLALNCETWARGRQPVPIFHWIGSYAERGGRVAAVWLY